MIRKYKKDFILYYNFPNAHFSNISRVLLFRGNITTDSRDFFCFGRTEESRIMDMSPKMHLRLLNSLVWLLFNLSNLNVIIAGQKSQMSRMMTLWEAQEQHWQLDTLSQNYSTWEADRGVHITSLGASWDILDSFSSFEGAGQALIWSISPYIYIYIYIYNYKSIQWAMYKVWQRKSLFRCYQQMSLALHCV